MLQKIVFLLLMLVLQVSFSFCQFNLPPAYTISNGVNDSALLIRSDFNKDGSKDVFMVIEREDHVKLFASVSKSGKSYKSLTHGDITNFTCCGSISFEKNIITITTKGMRYFEYYKFRYNKKLLNFELIGFDTESFGNAIHDGAGTRSLNLLTGMYEYSTYTAKDEYTGSTKKGKRKIKIPKKFTLSNFDEAFAFFEILSYNNE